jgi:hypothetical protein
MSASFFVLRSTQVQADEVFSLPLLLNDISSRDLRVLSNASLILVTTHTHGTTLPTLNTDNPTHFHSHRPHLRHALSLPPACPSRRLSTRLPTPPSVFSTARSPSPLRGVSSLFTDRLPLPLSSTVHPAPPIPTDIMASNLEDRSSPAGPPTPGHRAIPATRRCRQTWGDHTCPNRARGT